MKSLALIAVSATAATPALAHGGTHLHLHGTDLMMVGGIAALALVLLGFVLRR